MKYIILIKLSVLTILLFLLSSCGKKIYNSSEFDINSLKTLSDLAVCEYSFNNVAKINQTKGSGFPHIGEKDRKVFMEYEGKIKVGVDINEIIAKYDKEKRIITIPKAKIISIFDNPYTYKEFISKDGLFNKNTVEDEAFKNAISDSLAKMKDTVKNNNSLMKQAQILAESQIKAFINTFGNFDLNYIREY